MTLVFANKKFQEDFKFSFYLIILKTDCLIIAVSYFRLAICVDIRILCNHNGFLKIQASIIDFVRYKTVPVVRIYMALKGNRKFSVYCFNDKNRVRSAFF